MTTTFPDALDVFATAVDHVTTVAASDRNNVQNSIVALEQYANVILNVQTYGGAVGDGVTDDAIAINNTIAAAASVGGGVVYFPPGNTYLIGTSLTITSDYIDLVGGGSSSIIKAKSALNADMIKTPTTSGSSRNYCSIRSLQLDGNKGNVTSGNIVHFYGSRYCQLDRCLLVNAYDHALNLDGDGGAGFGYNNCITNNVFDLNTGVITDSNNEANYFANNQFKWCGLGNMANMSSGGHFITNNVFGSGGTYTVPALVLGNDLTTKVIGNRFDTVRHQAVKCNAGNQIVLGNECFKCCSATSNTESVIHIGANNRNVVMGNIVRTDSAATWQHAVHQDNPSDFNIIIGNQLTPGLTGTIQTDGGGTGANVWRDNVGFNPQGVTGITVGASPYTYTNTDNVPEMIHISGGTVSSVAKNSTTLFTTTNVSVLLAPSESVVVTYSVAPTLNKDRK